MRRLTIAIVASLLVVGACSTTPEDDEAGPDTEAADDGTAPVTTEADAAVTEPTAAAPETTEAGTEVTGDVTTVPDTTAVEAVVDDRAPGVTDSTIKVGVTYPDLTNLKAVLGIDHGSYEQAYTIVADAINAAGGIQGRTLELVFAPIDPQAADAGPAACTRLVEDEQVFVTLGFVQGDEVLCYVDTNEALFIGGEMTAERLSKAKVAWFSLEASEDQAGDGLQTLIDEGIMGDRVAVVGATGDEAFFDNEVRPILEAAGVEAEPAYIDTASGDANAILANAETIAQRLEAEGFEQLMFIGGASGAFFPTALARTQYRPQLIYLNLANAATYAGGEGNDLSILEGAVVVSPFDSNNLFPTLGGQTAECVATLEAGGHAPIIPGEEVPDGEPTLVTSGMSACRYLGLLQEILEATGPELNYGTYTTAANSLGEVELPGSPDPLTFGPPPSADGDQPQYISEFDPASGVFVVQGG